ncbi:MAG: single-stranded DNA-binding protein [Bacilli bacterium]
MLNQVTLIGRVVETPVVKKLESDNKATTLVLAVTRAFKNMNGNY